MQPIPAICKDTAPAQAGDQAYMCPPGAIPKPGSEMATPATDSNCCAVSYELLLASLELYACKQLHAEFLCTASAGQQLLGALMSLLLADIIFDPGCTTH
jgi:hypothetical protein